MSMSRLSDGPPDSGKEELEETQTGLAAWLQRKIGEGKIEYIGTINGIPHYRMREQVTP